MSKEISNKEYANAEQLCYAWEDERRKVDLSLNPHNQDVYSMVLALRKVEESVAGEKK